MTSMLKVRLTKDLKRLDRMERDVPRKATAAVSHVAIALREDIRSSWSESSPSSPGNAPASGAPGTTGNLDTSIIVDDTGRGSGGRFSSDRDAIIHFVRVDTSKGIDNQGRGNYELAVEEGTSRMEARPYFAPAVERMEALFPDFFGDIFKNTGVSMEDE